MGGQTSVRGGPLLLEEQGASYMFCRRGGGGALKFHPGGQKEGQQAATAWSLGL